MKVEMLNYIRSKIKKIRVISNKIKKNYKKLPNMWHLLQKLPNLIFLQKTTLYNTFVFKRLPLDGNRQLTLPKFFLLYYINQS